MNTVSYAERENDTPELGDIYRNQRGDVLLVTRLMGLGFGLIDLHSGRLYSEPVLSVFALFDPNSLNRPYERIIGPVTIHTRQGEE